MDRRSFLKSAAVASSALAITPSSFAKDLLSGEKAVRPAQPKGKVRMAMIGIGNRGHDNTLELYKTGLCEVVALCDVDMGSDKTKDIISRFPDVPRYHDFRKMFAEMADKIDAVMIGTPDFSHFVICMAAMKLGKHVYVEKPLCRTFLEAEILMEAEKKYGVVCQMGNQGHSEANYYQFKAWKEAGIIKDVTAITAHMNNSRRWHGWDPKITKYPDPEPIPETLDWDTWMGASHPRGYNHDFHNGQWRCWYEYGMGALGDWGAHIIDTAHRFLELGLPEEVNPVYLKDHNPFFFPMSSTIEFKFPKRGDMPPCVITWYDGLDNIPAVPEGYGVQELDPNIPLVAGQKIQPSKLNPGKEIYSKTLTFKGGTHGSPLTIIPEADAKKMEGKLPQVPEANGNHYHNFLRACLGQEEVHSPFSVTGPLSQVFCLGVIAQWTGHKIIFDRETKQIVNDPIANQLLWGPVPREGWAEYYKI